MNKKTHSFLFFWSIREIKQGNLWPIIIALILIVGSVFSLSGLANRFEQIVTLESKNALTADIIFRSANPLSQSIIVATNQNQFKTSHYTRFNTMAFSKDKMQLVSVKAVDSNYPLRGKLTLLKDNVLEHHVFDDQLWLEPKLFDLLQVQIGDSVSIGDADFKVSGKILEEPGLNFNPFRQMPTVYIHQNDIEKTGAIQLGSRVSYRLLINASNQAIQSLKQSVALSASDRWVSENNQNRSLDIFHKTKQYLSLTVFIIVLMSVITLILTCQNYVLERTPVIFMLKSLGASRSFLLQFLLTQLIMLLALGVLLGWGLGILLEFLLRLPLVDILPEALPSYGASPFILSFVICLVVGLPALLIPFFKLLNKSSSQKVVKKIKRVYIFAGLPLLFFLGSYGGDAIIWIVFIAILGTFLCLALISLLIIKYLNRFKLPVMMKLALTRIDRSKIMSGVQFGALGLCLMLIAMIWLIRSDLLSGWQQTLPKNTPNIFALNIKTSEKDQYIQLIDQKNLVRSEEYPIIRGRIVKINEQDAVKHAGGLEKSNALRRELNFTWGEGLPKSNQIVRGNWGNTKGVSVEQQVAKDLNIQLGDRLGFMINGETIYAKVNSIRKVNWREMKPNFFFIFTPDVLKKMPVTWLLSFRLAPDAKLNNQFLANLSRDYPTVSLIDLRMMIAKVQTLLRQIVSSITILAAVAVSAGVLLVFTLLHLSLSQREKEIRLYRTLGASQKMILQTLWFEYGAMALISSLIACLGAELAVAGLMKWGFELGVRVHLLLWVLLPILAFVSLRSTLSVLIKKLVKPVMKN